MRRLVWSRVRGPGMMLGKEGGTIASGAAEWTWNSRLSRKGSRTKD
jgi:hypothetical protein